MPRALRLAPVALLAFWIAAPVSSAAVTAVQDTSALRTVRDLLGATQAVTVFDHVTASAAGDVITLSGRVTSRSKREQLETEVSTVPGVRQIVNRIQVLSASPADDALRRKIARAIYGHPSFRQYAAMTHPPIRILVERGRVTLAGEVKTSVEKLVAHSIAEAEAKRPVGDELTVR
jgi:osmotically-inducible protein OsmY